MTLAEVAAACEGTLAGADARAEVTSVVIDSRNAAPGALFVALAGEHTDGHRFVGDALARGAIAALVRADAGVEGPAITVEDPLRALAGTGAAARARLPARAIAITGSSGKTGTKDLTAAAVGTTFRVTASPASYNNEIGVPLTVLSAGADDEVLVLEVGARGRGHIAALMPVVRPDVAVVTNVGAAHIEMFGTMEHTAEAKGELVEGVGTGTAVLNADDPRVRAMAARAAGPVVLFGRGPDADVRARDVTLDERARPSFTISAGRDEASVSLRLSGEHAVANALAAAAAALAVGVPLASAADGLGRCEPGTWRMQITDRDGRTIINDAYNANPESMAAALKTLVTIAAGRPTVAVLGEMAELGPASAEAHDRIGRLAVRLGVGTLIVVGERARAIHEAARLEGMFGGESHPVATPDEARALLGELLAPDAVVLVKASRAAGLERVAEALVGVDA